jgi:cleavage and polyadenylation specificity factor subunit 1
MEHFHWTLKAAIMCHADQHWTEALPMVLLGICTPFKEEDLQASVPELIYGKPLRIPGKLLAPTAEPVNPVHLITQLRQHMARLRPVPATRHTSPATFMHSDLEKCTHIFICQDTRRRALEPPYSGPYQVLSRRRKTTQLLLRGSPITVSTDRVKPAYMLNETDCGTTTFNPMIDATKAVVQTTSSRHHIHLPARFNI